MNDFDDLPLEYAEYVLRRMYHCLPSQLDEEDYDRIVTDLKMMEAELESQS